MSSPGRRLQDPTSDGSIANKAHAMSKRSKQRRLLQSEGNKTTKVKRAMQACSCSTLPWSLGTDSVRQVIGSLSDFYDRFVTREERAYLFARFILREKYCATSLNKTFMLEAKRASNELHLHQSILTSVVIEMQMQADACCSTVFFAF
jgi:phosphate/sulfate permease